MQRRRGRDARESEHVATAERVFVRRDDHHRRATESARPRARARGDTVEPARELPAGLRVIRLRSRQMSAFAGLSIVLQMAHRAGELPVKPIGRRDEGVERPALCTIWPGRERYFTLLDAGANPHAKPYHIVQSAVLGSNYARVALGLVRPKVGLLTIGTEEGKGNEVIHETHSMLKDIDGSIINYAGLIEGFQIFENVVDVVVCDGFVGNIVLKACESLSKLIRSFLDEELRRNTLRKTGALL